MNNFKRSVQIILTLALTGWLAIGCASNSTPEQSKEPVTQSHNESRLRNGDQITVRIDTGGNQAITSLDVIIDENGEISLPLINSIKAAGLTPAKLQERIVANYVPRFYVRCNATVLATIRFFYMGGEVRSPGRFNWTEDLTLLKAINIAGGFTDFANRGKVEVTRGKTKSVYNAEELRQHPDRDITIQPGDSLNVPRSIF